MRQNKERYGQGRRALVSFGLALAMLAALGGCVDDRQEPQTNTVPSLGQATPAPTPTATPEPEVPGASEVVQEIGIGWNLGNALESYDGKGQGLLESVNGVSPQEYYETYWGSPLTTEKVFDAVSQAGFGAVRIPVTWRDHMDEAGNISEAWLDRVQELVDMVLAKGMYCILNVHHDTGEDAWLKAETDAYENTSQRFAGLWRQLAERFADYDYHLIFEGANELLNYANNWSGAGETAYEVTNAYNQLFVDTVRQAGGNNAQRILLVNTYAANTDKDILAAFTVPQDTAGDRIIAAVHTYAPLQFTWTADDVTWDETYSDWDDARGDEHVLPVLQRVAAAFAEKGVPVMVTEFAAKNKNNEEDRAAYATYFVEKAKELGIVCFWWDDGGTYSEAAKVKRNGLLDRTTGEWFFPQIVQALVQAAQ